MSDFKDLAFEATAKGSPAGLVLIVFLVAGGVIQSQEPADHRVFVETLTICPSTKSADDFKGLITRASVRAHAKSEGPTSQLHLADNFRLPDYSISLLAGLLPLVPATGLARQGYLTAINNRGRNRPLSFFLNGPSLQLAGVHALGQAGTFAASQFARFLGTYPGTEFYERCGPSSVKSSCKKAIKEHFKVVELLPQHARPRPTTTTTTTTTTATTATTTLATEVPSEVGFLNSTQNETLCRKERSLPDYEDYENATSTLPSTPSEPEILQVPALCRNTRSTFSELFSSLHENPRFSSGSAGAATITLLFGLYLLARGKKTAPTTDSTPPPSNIVRCRLRGGVEVGEDASEEPTYYNDDMAPPVPPRSESPKAACLWNATEATAFLVLGVAGFCLLVNFFAQAHQSGQELLLGACLGIAVQLGVVLWSTYGNLFFDVRKCGNCLPPSASAAPRLQQTCSA